jgi:protein TonB
MVKELSLRTTFLLSILIHLLLVCSNISETGNEVRLVDRESLINVTVVFPNKVPSRNEQAPSPREIRKPEVDKGGAVVATIPRSPRPEQHVDQGDDRPALHVATKGAPLPSPAPKISTPAQDYQPGALKMTEAVPDSGANREPRYPIVARKKGWQGTVRLKVLVLSDGSVGELDVAGSSGYGLLDRAAVDAVVTWRFRPATKGDHPVDSWVEIPIQFELL